MLSAAMAGVLGFVFWALNTHQYNASTIGSVSGEVSAISFLAIVGSLNLSSIFARFLPVAGRSSRRMIIISYGAVALTGLSAALIFIATPLARGLILGGGVGRVAFAVCVILNSIFNIQDGGLVGFGRFGWVPVENALVALSRLALLPLAASFLSASTGILSSWALPMLFSVVVVNILIIGPLASEKMVQRPRLPPVRELSRLVAIDSVTTAVYAAVSAFLPALVTHQLGASEGGYFYVPWVIATMVTLLLNNISISMVREVVAHPHKAGVTIRRSMGLALIVVLVVMMTCLLTSHLVLAPLGSTFAVHGAILLRWVGLGAPATAIIVLFWAVCLVRQRPWPVFVLNITTSGAILGFVLTLGHGSDVSRVGLIYCIVQWTAALAVSWPAAKALRVIRYPGRTAAVVAQGTPVQIRAGACSSGPATTRRAAIGREPGHR
jgi:hypothetical protein